MAVSWQLHGCSTATTRGTHLLLVALLRFEDNRRRRRRRHPFPQLRVVRLKCESVFKDLRRLRRIARGAQRVADSHIYAHGAEVYAVSTVWECALSVRLVYAIGTVCTLLARCVRVYTLQIGALVRRV